jgi:hypothetical protein
VDRISEHLNKLAHPEQADPPILPDDPHRESKLDSWKREIKKFEGNYARWKLHRDLGLGDPNTSGMKEEQLKSQYPDQWREAIRECKSRVDTAIQGRPDLEQAWKDFNAWEVADLIVTGLPTPSWQDVTEIFPAQDRPDWAKVIEYIPAEKLLTLKELVEKYPENFPEELRKPLQGIPPAPEEIKRVITQVLADLKPLRPLIATILAIAIIIIVANNATIVGAVDDVALVALIPLLIAVSPELALGFGPGGDRPDDTYSVSTAILKKYELSQGYSRLALKKGYLSVSYFSSYLDNAKLLTDYYQKLKVGVSIPEQDILNTAGKMWNALTHLEQ